MADAGSSPSGDRKRSNGKHGGASRSSTGGNRGSDRPSRGRTDQGQGNRSGRSGRGASSDGRSSQKRSSYDKSGGRSQGGSDERSHQASAHRSGRRRDLKGAAANLPNWVVEDLARVTPDRRVAPALEALGEASEAIANGSFHKAFKKAQVAKELAPRDATIRETLGLAAYRLGNWKVALNELRTYRRLSGETTHMPVEMDVHRALERDDAVSETWTSLKELGGKPGVMKEGAVVYASHLIDTGDLDSAWQAVRPGRLTHEPFEEDLRLWYVAARVAALRGDAETAGKLRNNILQHDPGFPGIDDLEALIARTGS